MQKFKSALKNPVLYVGLAIGLVVAFAYSRFIPSAVKSAASKLPGAGA